MLECLNKQQNKVKKMCMKSFGLGMVSGIRVFVAPAWIATTSHRKYQDECQLAAFLEFLYDQSDLAQDRTEWKSLLARVLSGGWSGFYADPSFWGISSGMLGAWMSTYLSFSVRKYVHETYKVPSYSLGLLEDLFAVGACHRLLTS